MSRREGEDVEPGETPLMRVLRELTGVCGLVIVLLLVSIPLASLFYGPLVARVLVLGMMVGLCSLLWWIQHIIAFLEAAGAWRVATRVPLDQPRPRRPFYAMEVRHDPVHGWSFHDLSTGDVLPLEVGDIFCLVPPAGLPHEEG